MANQTLRREVIDTPVTDMQGKVIYIHNKRKKKSTFKSKKDDRQPGSPYVTEISRALKPADARQPTTCISDDTEELYKNLFNNSPFAIGILDKETMQLLEVNETATKLYGYSTEEFLQLTAYDIRIPEQHALLNQQIESGNYTNDKTIRSHRKKNGDIIQIEPTITQITYKGKQAYLMTILDVTDKLLMQEELGRTKITRRKEITRAALQAQEKSRADIGRELHDNINQLLVASMLFLKKAQPATNNDKALIEMGTDIIGSAITEIRKLSSSLVSPSLNKLSLKESICHLLPSLSVSNIAVEFDVRINEALIAEELKVSLYRIIQEQFSNIIKHAAATKVKVTMIQSGNLLSMEISDNGKGFDPKLQARGIGLDNIIHRADSYNGTIYIESSPGCGCKIGAEFLI
jgi:PAS domain S-box-containing protein